MFRLFSRLPDGLQPIAEIFQSHIQSLGNDKIEQRTARQAEAGIIAAPGGGPTGKEKDAVNDPQFIKDLLELHDKY
jgi:cullin 1